MDSSLQIREETLEQIKENLVKVQQMMKAQANKLRYAIEFEVGKWVWVKLKPYKQLSLPHRLNNKLCKRYFRPFKIIKKVSSMAYQ